MTETNNQLLKLGRLEQYRTVDELIEKSRPSPIYYTLLILSTLIVSSGILIDNASVIIGGMLVTPVLTPLLVIGLGLAIGEIAPIKHSVILIFKSFVLVVGVSILLGFVFGQPEKILVFENTLRTAVLYFIISLTSGIAATFAWARKEMAVALPGVAIAVALVPPLSLVGIGFSLFNLALSRFYFFILVFNLVGIIIGSLIVFSLLKFHKAEREVKEKTQQVEREELELKEQKNHDRQNPYQS
jgi:uncharacterized hydrophobic protein (TIGR00271 family)